MKLMYPTSLGRLGSAAGTGSWGGGTSSATQHYRAPAPPPAPGGGGGLQPGGGAPASSGAAGIVHHYLYRQHRNPPVSVHPVLARPQGLAQHPTSLRGGVGPGLGGNNSTATASSAVIPHAPRHQLVPHPHQEPTQQHAVQRPPMRHPPPIQPEAGSCSIAGGGGAAVVGGAAPSSEPLHQGQEEQDSTHTLIEHLSCAENVIYQGMEAVKNNNTGPFSFFAREYFRTSCCMAHLFLDAFACKDRLKYQLYWAQILESCGVAVAALLCTANGLDPALTGEMDTIGKTRVKN